MGQNVAVRIMACADFVKNMYFNEHAKNMLNCLHANLTG